MTPPAALPASPATGSVRSTPAATSTARGDAAAGPFDQHLQQVARDAQSTRTSAAAKPSTAPAADARDDSPSPSSAASRHAQESSVPTVASASATPAAGAQPGTATTARGQADAALVDAALAMAQAAPTAAAAGDAMAPDAPKAMASSKAGTPDEEGAATLAGAMLAMLGQVTGGMAGAASDADAAPVSADGPAPGPARAAAALQGLDDKALAAAVAAMPAASQAGQPAGVERLIASSGTDTHKDHGLEALALAGAPAPAPATQTQALPQLQLSAAPGSSGFADELGQQVVWLGQQDIRQAKIRLHPEDLGSLDVHLSVSHDRVDVVFSAQHPAAVTAVQQSLPQLDHMLARHGLSLGHAEVGQQQGGGDGQARGEGRGAAAVDEVDEAQGVGLPLATSRIGLLDAFA